MMLDRKICAMWLISSVAFCFANSIAMANESTKKADHKPQLIAKAETGIEWNQSFKESVSKAKDSGKLVLADVYTKWCVPCKLMEKKTFTDPKFVSLIKEKFVAVKLDAEDKAEGGDVAKKFDVDAYPTGLIVTGDGKLVKRVVGFQSASDYIRELSNLK